jgi:hypothetical protein
MREKAWKDGKGKEDRAQVEEGLKQNQIQSLVHMSSSPEIQTSVPPTRLDTNAFSLLLVMVAKCPAIPLTLNVEEMRRASAQVTAEATRS